MNSQHRHNEREALRRRLNLLVDEVDIVVQELINEYHRMGLIDEIVQPAAQQAIDAPVWLNLDHVQQQQMRQEQQQQFDEALNLDIGPENAQRCLLDQLDQFSHSSEKVVRHIRNYRRLLQIFLHRMSPRSLLRGNRSSSTTALYAWGDTAKMCRFRHMIDAPDAYNAMRRALTSCWTSYDHDVLNVRGR
uniref:Uncharacterized protein n=1 Tax=Globodera pallida TaxID=36090 RepID=A0A183C8S5_GLOPA